MRRGIDRRDFMTAGMGALVLAAGAGSALGQSEAARVLGAARKDGYVLPPLPYEYDALEPFLGAETLGLHHGKHHQGYVNGLNVTLEKLAVAREKGDYAAIKGLSRDLAFHGSGHVLHALYWLSMRPGGSALTGRLSDAVLSDFGSTQALADQFAAAAAKVEGSGWAVLAYEPMGGRLLVLQAEKHQNLAVWGAAPLLVCDLWEHAYYVDYRNRRKDYVAGFMDHADWAAAAERYARAAAED